MSGDVKEKTALQRKGIMIAAVILFSSISFCLGYFVGKLGREGKTEDASQIQPLPQPVQARAADPQDRKAAEAVLPDPAAPDRDPAKTEQTPKTAGLTREGPTPPPAMPRAPGPKGPDPASSALKQKEQAVAAAPQKNGSADDEAAEPRKNVVKYTVQLGAVKASSEAKKLKTKLAKKGYKVYITSAVDKRKHKIYKVRTGEFQDRKSAEILALKLGKSEGLKAFVTEKD